MRSALWRSFLAACTIAGAACSSDPAPAPDSGFSPAVDAGITDPRRDGGANRLDGSVFIPLDAGSPDSGPQTAQASATIGPEGGLVTLGAASLTVPAGAVASPQVFTISLLAETVPAGFRAYSPRYSFEPSGFTFPVPLVMTLPFDSRGEPRLASLFTSGATSSAYIRIGGQVRSNTVSGSVTSLGTSFVADGADFEEAADPSCVKTRLLEVRTQPPSQVAVYAAVEDCSGLGVVGLTEQDFSLREDGASVGAGADLQLLDSSTHQYFLTLALDLSGVDREQRLKIIGGAKALVYALLVDRQLPVQIRIDLFAGDTKSTEWQSATLDPYRLLERLNEAVVFTADAPSTTNLHGAIVDALARSAAAQQAYRARNYGGTFTAGFVLVFTRGPDSAGLTSRDQALAAIGSSTDRVFALALEAGDGEPRVELAALAPAGILGTPADANQLWRDFGRVGARIAKQLPGIYLLGYCSPRRGGQHTLEVLVTAPSTQASAGVSFDASGFADGCRRSAFQELCVDTDCGGLACGACDDRLGACNPVTRQCDNYCRDAGRCGGTITNPWNYTQDCSTTPNWDFCSSSGMCRDFLNDSANCGRCDSVCPYPSRSCFRGTCRCVSPTIECDGSCINPAEDQEHCGNCETACTASEACVKGSCQCVKDVCQGACTDLATDPRNCGSCGHDCGLGDCSKGICGPERLVTTTGGSGYGRAIALDETFIYFGNDATYRMPKAGGALETLYTPPFYASLTDVVLAGGRLFQAQFEAASAAAIVEIPLGGGSPSTVATGSAYGFSTLTYLGADSTFVYGLFTPAALKVPLAGGPAVEAFRPSRSCLGFVPVPGGVAWIDTGSAGGTSLMRLDTLTSATTELATDPSPDLGGLATDGTTVFWATRSYQPTGCTLWAVPVAGGPKVALESSAPCYRDITVDGDDLFLSGDGLFKMPKAGGPKVQLSTANATDMVADSSSVYFRLYGDNSSVYRVSRR